MLSGPLFEKARVLTTSRDPGEILLIPHGSWHPAKIVSPWISVSSFVVSLKGLVVGRIPEKIRLILHGYGLYGQDYTCHMTQAGKRIAK